MAPARADARPIIRAYNWPMVRPASLSFLLCAAAFAAGTAPTIDQSLSMKSVAGAQISPDGRTSPIRSSRPIGTRTISSSRSGSPCRPPASATSSPAARSRQQRPAVVAGFAPAGVHHRSRRQAADLPDLPGGRRGHAADREENGVGAMAWSPDGTCDRVHVHRSGLEGQEGSQGEVRRVRNHRRRLHHESSVAWSKCRRKCPPTRRSCRSPSR